MENEEKNLFEQASQEAENTVSQDVTKQGEDGTAKAAQEIDVDTISDKKYIEIPKKTEIGKETPVMEITRFMRETGRWQKPKDPQDDIFWTGLVKKGKNGQADEEQDEANLYGLVDGEENCLQLKSWEMFFKVYDFVKYCKQQKIMFKGQKIKFKRVNEGQKNSNRNWELHVTSLGIKFVGISKTQTEVQKI